MYSFSLFCVGGSFRLSGRCLLKSFWNVPIFALLCVGVSFRLAGRLLQKGSFPFKILSKCAHFHSFMEGGSFCLIGRLLHKGSFPFKNLLKGIHCHSFVWGGVIPAGWPAVSKGLVSFQFKMYSFSLFCVEGGPSSWPASQAPRSAIYRAQHA